MWGDIMNIGITFGCYCPLHQGHLDTIMKAKKENDVCYVFVCGYDNDRGGDILPLQKRYRLISEFLSSENVIVCKINDTELGLDESMSKSNWQKWLEVVYNEILHRYSTSVPIDIKWYVGEERYVQDILSNTPFGIRDKYNITDEFVELFDRAENHVSGTECRDNPIKYWSKITAPFRPYFSHNILVAGTASEGKTTLVQDIGKYFNIPYSYEKGRDNCVTKTDPEFDVEDFIYNLYEQHKYNKELIHSPQNQGIFISDTDNVVTLMYAFFYSKRTGFGITQSDYKLLFQIANAYMQKTKWDKIFLIKPSKKGIVDDGTRYMADSDYAIRFEFYEFLKNTYDYFGYKYEELDGGYYQNFLTVKNYINNVIENAKQ